MCSFFIETQLAWDCCFFTIHSLKCGFVQTRYLGNKSTNFYEISNISRTKQVAGRDVARIFNFSLCPEIYVNHNAKRTEKIASCHAADAFPMLFVLYIAYVYANFIL